MNPKFHIETLKYLRLRKLKQLAHIKNKILFINVVWNLTSFEIGVNFNLIKTMNYEEFINQYNKSHSNNINLNNYQTIVGKSDSDLSDVFKYLINLNIQIDKNFENLDLCDRKIEDDMVKVISLCVNLKDLIGIDLSYNKISENGLKYFIECGFLKKITYFALKHNNISSEGVEYISKCEFLKNLTWLNLGDNKIGDDGIKYFNRCVFLKNLEILCLSHNNISSIGLKYLSECKFLTKLTRLHLNNNIIDDEGIIYFVKCDLFIQLVFLDLSKNNLSYEMLRLCKKLQLEKNIDLGLDDFDRYVI